jgi:AmmeMemoRadiSam system protein A
MDQDLRRTAGECGYRSMLVALGVTEQSDANCEVISYEAPFGVGYLVAQLDKTTPHASAENADVSSGSSPGAMATGSSEPSANGAQRTDFHRALPLLARLTVETFVNDGVVITPPKDLPDELNTRAGCFVSLKTLDGDLRGCIGTIEPVKDTLAEEIIANAVSAATRDPRFPPVRKAELPNLKYSVDVLSAPEPCTLDDLDPEIYGVIVEDERSFGRGLLLPKLEGIDTASQQVEIASRKAGIKPGATVKLFRFRADRYRE